MAPHRSKQVAPLLVSLAFAATVLVIPRGAEALSGLYLQLGVGFGSFSGSALTVTEDPNMAGDIPLIDSETCCPPLGLASQFRAGFSILGFAGPEFGLVGNGFDLGGNIGGAGFIGGGIRIFPIKFISLAGVDTKDFPIDVGVGALLGYAIVGRDFAYSGSFFDLDLDVQYRISTNVSAGIRLDMIFPSYSDFVFTDYKNNRGRCLDSGGNHDLSGGVLNKDDAVCAGRGPSTTFISPELIITFHFDLLDV